MPTTSGVPSARASSRIRRAVAVSAAAALAPLVALASPASAAPDSFQQISPTPTTYVERTDFIEMRFGAAGDVTAPVWAVNLTIPSAGGSNSGCFSDQFAGFPAGSIALVQRGACTFGWKASNALAAGAAGVIIFNEGNVAERTAVIYGTLGTAVGIQVVGTSFAVGVDLANGVANGATGSVVRMVTDGLAPAVSPDEQLAALDAALDNTGVAPSTAQPLRSKLDAAQAALDRDNVGAACNQLAAFENQVRAQSGKKLTTAQADDLLARSAALRSSLAC